MSSFERNKVIASVLTAMIVAMVAGILSNMLVRTTPLEKPVFIVAGGEPTAGAPAEQASARQLLGARSAPLLWAESRPGKRAKG